MSYLVRSAQSASRGACLSWLSGKLQLCSSITQTRSSILSHKLRGTGGSSVLWGGFIIFQDEFLCSWLPQLEQQVGNALAQLSDRAPVGPEQGRAVGLGLSSSVSAEQCQCRWTPLCSSSEPQPIVAEAVSFIPEGGRCCGCAGFQSPDSRTPPYKQSSWDLLWPAGVWNWLLGIKGSFCRPPVKFPLGLTKIFKVS